MNYIILEIQTFSDGTAALLQNVYADRNQAEQQYHTVLAFAAVSNLPEHAAVMLRSSGAMIKSESYTHVTTAEPANEETTASPE